MPLPFGVTGIISALVLLIFAGGIISGFFSDVAYLFSCSFCSDAQKALGSDIAEIFKAGQQKIKNGVEGILELRGKPDLQAKDPIMWNLLLTTARNEIYFGLIMSVIYIALFFVLIKKSVGMLTNFEPPTLLALILSVGLVGIITWAAGGFAGFPYEGWIALASHSDIWAVKFLDVLSPLPINVTASNVSL